MSKFGKIILWILIILTGLTCLIDLIAIPFYFIEKGVLDGIEALVDLVLMAFWEVVYFYVFLPDTKKESEESNNANDSM